MCRPIGFDGKRPGSAGRERRPPTGKYLLRRYRIRLGGTRGWLVGWGETWNRAIWLGHPVTDRLLVGSGCLKWGGWSVTPFAKWRRSREGESLIPSG